MRKAQKNMFLGLYSCYSKNSSYLCAQITQHYKQYETYHQISRRKVEGTTAFPTAYSRIYRKVY